MIHLIMQNMHGIFMGTAAECAYGVRSVKCQHLVIYFAQEHMGVGEGGGGACYLNSSPRNYSSIHGSKYL